jgi:hypothetical protein
VLLMVPLSVVSASRDSGGATVDNRGYSIVGVHVVIQKGLKSLLSGGAKRPNEDTAKLALRVVADGV